MATTHASEATGHGHGHGHHNPHQAHHYDTMQQQFDSGKLGMWLFIASEILFFSGLFVGYTVFRSLYPETWSWCSQFLDTRLGAINTAVLIFSSFTMAWAVRAAQLNQKNLMVTLMIITFLCGAGFLVVKYFEYSHKFHLGLYFGEYYSFRQENLKHGAHGGHAGHGDSHAHDAAHEKGDGHTHEPGAAHSHDDDKAHDPEHAGSTSGSEIDALNAGAIDPPAAVIDPSEPADAQRKKRFKAAYKGPHNMAPIFFSIYYFMTALHATHIFLGLVVLAWLIKRGMAGEFGSDYFGPVDYFGLYWHLVDLIWIYLFPLLYLIPKH